MGYCPGMIISPIQKLLPESGPWVAVRDCDASVRHVFDRHYSRRPDPRPKFFGPGEYICLRTACGRAIFGWQVSRFRADGQEGANCVFFRNEGAGLSSDLILAAEQVAWQRWPGTRLFTFVDPGRIRSTNPGYCFIRAGWERCGRTKTRGLVILEK